MVSVYLFWRRWGSRLLVGDQKITAIFPKQKYLKAIKSSTLKFRKWEKSEQRRTTLPTICELHSAICMQAVKIRDRPVAILFHCRFHFFFVLSCNHNLSWYSNSTLWRYYSSLCVGPQQISFFFLISATTHVESWLSPQFSSIQGGLGLVPTT